ncbi:Protein phosphatase inhibitor 2 [Orchesella cincta]|uniref:Protein phosphatase inhibitor 2 n=1 Tax=Orchesella cincta TaxID=48709 RepID=A0A1D2MCE2_ORCCI|nr:Protein phosphatase inhibitor 2 [Orchesella cincta]
MTENLNKKPPKGILKTSSSFDTASSVASPNAGNSGRRNSGVVNSEKNELPEDDDGGGSAPESYVCVRKHSKTAKFDEMNILETYHPATKTYGHMKIEEPKTPFSYYEDADEELEPSQVAARSKESVDADELARKLEETAKRGQSEEEPEVEEESDDDDEEDPESKASRMKFESKRKAHYNEYYAVKLARKLMEQEEDDDEVKGGPPKNHDSEKFIPEEETLVDEDTPEGMQDA